MLVMTMSLNVAINSSSALLITVIISNQFMELKTCVHKRYDPQSLFLVTTGDVIERFQMTTLLALVVLKNTLALGELSMMSGVAMCFVGELIVDWLKHAFITNFSSIKPQFYSDLDSVLRADLFKTSAYFADTSFTTCHRIGFVPLPLACCVGTSSVRVSHRSLDEV